MRRAVTIVELIFSMVIIAFVFTIVPKMISVTAKSSEQGKKEDAIFNALSVLATTSYLAWDEAQTIYENNGSIITINNGQNDFNCTEESNYKCRRGAFYTENENCPRACYGEIDVANIGYDSGDNDEFGADDIDDINGSENNELFESLGYIDYVSGSRVLDYNITANIYFVSDINLNGQEENITIDLNQTQSSNPDRTNVKFVNVKVRRNDGSSKAGLGSSIASFYYFAFNLGIARDIPRRYIFE